MGFSLDTATSAREDATNIVTDENSAEIVMDIVDDNAKDVDEDREEGEIIEDTPVEYEDISSDEEVNLRKRIQELEARNIELEKIASISSAKATLDYAKEQIPFQYQGLENQKQAFINLVDDDDDAEEDNKNKNVSLKNDFSHNYCRRKQRRSLKLSSKSTRNKERSSSIKHERKHGRCRRRAHRNLIRESKKDSSSRDDRIKTLVGDRGYSSEDENTLLLDREKLRAALRRDTPHRSTTTSLRNKLKVVKQTVEKVIDNSDDIDIDDEDNKSNQEIFQLLDAIGVNSERGSDKETDIEDESISLEEQELRLIALKSAIVKKHEARKKRKVIEARPYSPTDTDIIMEEFNSKLTKPLAEEQPDELDACVMSPLPVSPESFDKSLLPVDMDIVCSETSQSPIFFNEMPHQQNIHYTTGIGPWISITDIPLPNDHHNILSDSHYLGIFKSTLQPIIIEPDEIEQPKSPEDVEMTDTNYLPDKIISTNSTSVKATEPNVQTHSDDSHIDEEEEIALRALLIANLGSPKNARRKHRQNNESILPKTDNQINKFSSSASTLTSYKNNNTLSSNHMPDNTIPKQESSNANNNLSSLSSMTPTFVPILQKENRDVINFPDITINLKEAVKRIKTKYNTQANQKQANNVVNHQQHIKQLGMKRNNRSDIKNSNLIVVNLSKLPTNVEDLDSTNKKQKFSDDINIVEIKDSKSTILDKSELPKNVEDSTNNEKRKFSDGIKNDKVENNESETTISQEIPSTLDSRPVETHSVIVNVKPADLPKKSNIAAFTKTATVQINKSIVGDANNKRPQQLNTDVVKNTIKTSKLLSTSSKNVVAKKVKVNSRVITNIQAKPVKKLVIQLENSDTDTETDLDDELIELSSNNLTEADRLFDNASPSSIAMDSPSCGPCSPISTNMTSTNDETADENSTVVSSPAFEQKLDEFLKKVRTKQENDVEIKIKSVPKIVTVKKESSKIASKLSDTPVTPLAVRHLPASAQLEYRTLVTRMRNLEKQKTHRQQIRPTITTNRQLQSSLKVIPFTVTIPNDQSIANDEADQASKNISSIGDLKITLKNTGDRIIQSCNKLSIKSNSNNSSLPPSSSTKPDSLVKQVLVKNVSKQVQKQNALVAQKDTNLSNSKQNVPLISKANSVKFDEKQNSIPLKPKMKRIVIEHKLDSSYVKNVVKQLPLPEVAKMSDDDKRNVLKTAEKDYVEHSSKLMNEIENMHSLVSSARIAKQKQFDLESEYDSLKLRMEQIEQQLNGQKVIISKLYPNISMSHKTVLNSRQQSVQLSSYCMKIGKSISGEEYKIPDDNRTCIAEKLKIIAMDTKLLKTMKKTIKDSTVIQSERKLSTDESASVPLTKENSCNVAVDSESKSSSINELSTNVLENVSPIELSTQTIKKETNLKTTGDIADVCNDSTQVGKYRSPLDHMQNESSPNPDAILCPFQLMGQCEDKECSYKHLK